MKHLTYAAICTVLLAASACKRGPSEEQLKEKNDLQTQVMAVHDSSMLLVDSLYRVKKKLIVVKAEGSEKKKVLSSEEKNQMQNSVLELQKADDAMQKWMTEWKEPNYETTPHEEIMKYLNDELTEIKAVDAAMKASLATGAALLEQFPPKPEEEEEEKKESKSKKDKKDKPVTKKEMLKSKNREGRH